MSYPLLPLLAAILLGGPSSAWAIFHGIPIPESTYPAVRRLVLRGTGTCTGTFIGSRTMVTAAHCIVAALDKGVFSEKLQLTVDGKRPVGYRMHPRFESRERDMIAYDVAVVQFGPEANFPHLKLARSGVSRGAPVTIVGYGEVDGIVGRKHMGRNFIDEVMLGQYLIRASHSSFRLATATSGDSGGPMLNELDELIAVNGRRNAVTLRASGTPTELSSHVSVTEPEIARFIADSVVELARQGGGRRGD